MVRFFGKISLTFIFTFSFSVWAQGVYTKKELNQFFTKNKHCLIAVGMIHPYAPKMKTGEDAFMHEVLCIADVTSGEGTIKEASGCAFFRFNVEDKSTLTTYSMKENPALRHKSGIPMIDKSCADGLDDLMNVFSGHAYGEKWE
jgi:hypothetical protein